MKANPLFALFALFASLFAGSAARAAADDLEQRVSNLEDKVKKQDRRIRDLEFIGGGPHCLCAYSSLRNWYIPKLGEQPLGPTMQNRSDCERLIVNAPECSR